MLGGIFGTVVDVARDIFAPPPQVVIRPEVRTTVPVPAESQTAKIFAERWVLQLRRLDRQKNKRLF